MVSTHIQPNQDGGEGGYLTITQEYLERFKARLLEIPPPGKGKSAHGYIMSAANLGARAGIAKDNLVQTLMDYTPKGNRVIPKSDYIRTVDKAYKGLAEGTAHYSSSKLQVVEDYDWAEMSRSLVSANQGKTFAGLPGRPLPSAGPDMAIAFVKHVYRPEEWLFIGNRLDRGAFHRSIRTAGDWVAYWESSRTGLMLPEQFAINPLMDPGQHAASGFPTKRGKVNVVTHRYLLVEADEEVPLADQVPLLIGLIGLGEKIVAITYSGGKSYHALLRVDRTADTWAEASARLDLYTGDLTGLGFDTQAKDPCRLSRLPGACRCLELKSQDLVYLSQDGFEDCWAPSQIQGGLGHV